MLLFFKNKSVSSEKHKLLSSLKKAVAEDQFIIYVQPQVSIKNNTTTIPILLKTLSLGDTLDTKQWLRH